MKTLTPALLLTTLLTAQSFTVSPRAYTNQEGPGANTWPWISAFRYQQVYTDLTTPLLVTGIAWRNNFDQFANNAAVPRTLDMEILMCASSFAAWSTTFASNYIGTPARVFTRKTANMPDYRTPPVQRPAPFDFALLLDVPFVHLGMNDLLYEILMYSTTSSSSIFCDSPVYLSAPTISWGSFTSAGSGCTTSNGRFLARSQISQTFATGLVDFRFDCSGGPASANGAVLVGFAPLNVPIPGLCTNLYTDGSLGNLPFATTSAGSGSTGQLPLPWNPAWQNLVVTAQAAALDASQPGIPVAATQGLRCSIAPPSLPVTTGARLWSQNNTTAVTGTSSTNGWLVTQFRH